MTAGPSTNLDWMHHETIPSGPGDGARRCGNCDKTDGLVYTSNPPMRKCTITGKFHFYNDVCDAPQTNADRIRAMSDEELAKWLGDMIFPECLVCPATDEPWCLDRDCFTVMLAWLRAPADGARKEVQDDG